MKKLKVVFLALAVASLGFVSCNDDDDNTPGNSDNPNDISGTYNLVEFNTPTDTDLNGDGTANKNQMTEHECYAASKIEFRGDNTVTYNYRALTEDNAQLDCYTEEINGSWSTVGAVGNTAAITVTLRTGTNQEEELNFIKEGATIRYNHIDEYPIRTGDVYSTLPGVIERVFQK